MPAQSPLSKLHVMVLHPESQSLSPSHEAGQSGAHEGGGAGAAGGDTQSPLSKLHAALLHVSSQSLSPCHEVGQPGAHSSLRSRPTAGGDEGACGGEGGAKQNRFTYASQ